MVGQKLYALTGISKLPRTELYSRLRFFFHEKLNSTAAIIFHVVFSTQSSELIEGSSRTNFEARSGRREK